jgi:hypothetical protein
MKRLLFLVVALLYCNATWLAVVWGRESFHAFIAFLLIFLIPITTGVVLFLVFHTYVSEDWSAVFVGAGVLIPMVFMFTYATRMPDYVAFVRHGRPAFDGRLADVKDDGSMFYSVRDFVVKNARDGHFGASYSSSTRKNSTTYSKHFVIPLFEHAADPTPRAWLFGSYRTGSLRVDDGTHGIYGLDQTRLPQRARGDVIHGLRMADEDARRAVSQYLRKMNLPAGGEPIVLRPVDQSAAEFYRTGEIQLWAFTAALNVLFLGVCVYASRDSHARPAE